MDEALFGFNLGERSRLAYWVNRIFYPEPIKASCKMADATGRQPENGGLAIRALADPAEGVEPLLPTDASKREREALERIARETLQEGDKSGVSAGRLPRPGAAVAQALA